jgi:hypothetical protein
MEEIQELCNGDSPCYSKEEYIGCGNSCSYSMDFECCALQFVGVERCALRQKCVVWDQ